MTNDIKALIDYYEREKGLSREKILLALESAFLSALSLIHISEPTRH